jgi:hypothetical protein
MKAKQAREDTNQEVKPSCGAISHLDEPCNESATIFCDQCDRWFCVSHAEDDQWHPCRLKPGEEGGEA